MNEKIIENLKSENKKLKKDLKELENQLKATEFSYKMLYWTIMTIIFLAIVVSILKDI